MDTRAAFRHEGSVGKDSLGKSIVHQFRWGSGSLWILGACLITRSFWQLWLWAFRYQVLCSSLHSF